MHTLAEAGGRRSVDRDNQVFISTICIVVYLKLVVSKHTILSLYNNILWNHDVEDYLVLNDKKQQSRQNCVAVFKKLHVVVTFGKCTAWSFPMRKAWGPFMVGHSSWLHKKHWRPPYLCFRLWWCSIRGWLWYHLTVLSSYKFGNPYVQILMTPRDIPQAVWE